MKFDIADRSCLQEVRRDGGRGAQLQGVLRDDPQQERLVPAQVGDWERERAFIYVSFHYDHPNNVIRNILHDIFDKEPSSGLE